MNWAIFAILAALVWSVVNIFDKFFLTKWVKDSSVVLMALGLANLLPPIIIYFTCGFSEIPIWNIWLCLLAGISYTLGNWFYFMAAQREEISKVIPLLLIDPLYTAILAAIFFNEILSPTIYLGIILLVAGAILISTNNFKVSINKKARWVILIAPVTFALCNILNKAALNHGDFWTVFAYIRTGSFLGMLLVIPFKAREIRAGLKGLGRKFSLIFANESLNVVGAAFFAAAIASGYVSVANALTAVQPFFVLIWASLLTIIVPKIIKEKTSLKIFALKAIAVCLIFAGTVLVTK